MGKEKKKINLANSKKKTVYMYVATGEKNFLLNQEKGSKVDRW
jgi:hypothetical protein